MLTTALFLFAIASTVAQAPQAAPGSRAAVGDIAGRGASGPAGSARTLRRGLNRISTAGLQTHTVYRPTNLIAFPAKDTLPIVVWGNGACRMDGLMFERFLTKIASHGFLVVAVGPEGRRARLPTTIGDPPSRGGATGGAPDPGHQLGHQGEPPAPAARCSARSTPGRSR